MTLAFAGAVMTAAQAAAGSKPNILVIWGDDIGQFNVSAYNHGMMGYKTPNIDRLAKEGALFQAQTANPGLLSTLGTVAGGVIGGVFGGAEGAQTGAQLGGLAGGGFSQASRGGRYGG